jgi:molybdenum cofactor cytidylyltransferase
MNNVCAILLAAGRSSRMPAFKPLLPFGDKTVISTVVDNLREAGVDRIVVVVGHEADKVKKHLRDREVVFSVNDDPDSEMSASIACGVKALPDDADAVLIALADHPAIDAEAIRLIIEEWQYGSNLVIPEFNKRGGHPVLIDLRFREELLQLDASLGLRSFFQTHHAIVKRLAVNCSFIARDMDTWDDYRTLHKEVFGSFPAQTDDEQERSLSKPN